MGLFSKKNTKKAQSSSDAADMEDFSEFDGLDDVDFSADTYPTPSYDEIEDDDEYDEYTFLGFEREPGNPGDSEKQEAEEDPGKGFRRMVIAATIFIIAGLGIYTAVSGGSDNSNPTQTQESTDSNEGTQGDSHVEGGDKGLVVTESVGKTYTSSSDGNPINGSGAILAFDYDYYVNRDGDAAFEHFNPDVNAYSGSYVQEEIDKVPQGTTHELEITPKRIGESYDVVLTIKIPGADPIKADQKFTTMEKNGVFYIKNFTSQMR